MSTVLLFGFILLLAFCFAKVEIHIEGGDGWAASLPTWRIEKHWLLSLFWGGRPMTGYHARMFSFIALVFHLPPFIVGRWSPTMEARMLASVMVFWIIEDFLWFVLNPHYGIHRFRPEHVSWHKHWFLGAPWEYWAFTAVAALLYAYGTGAI